MTENTRNDQDKAPKPHRDWHDRLTLLLLVGATIAAAFAAVFTWEALIISERAWVAPRGIGLKYVPPDAKYWIVGLEFKNTGNQPALEFRRNVAAFPIVSKDIHNVAVLENAILREMGGDKCTEFSGEDTGFAVFPETEHTVRIQISPAHVEQYEANTHFLVVAGYFAYETFGRTRRSCFCRFLDFTADSSNPQNWRSSVCSISEYAD